MIRNDRSAEVRRLVLEATARGFDAAGAKLVGVVKAQMKAAEAPSRPGEPPHRQTGQLAESVSHAVDASEPVTLSYGSSSPYARALELGTRDMAPRPFLVPPLLERRAELEETFLAAANKK